MKRNLLALVLAVGLLVTLVGLAVSTISQAYAFDVTCPDGSWTFQGDFLGTGTQRSTVGDSIKLVITNHTGATIHLIAAIYWPDGTLMNATGVDVAPGGSVTLPPMVASKPGVYRCTLVPMEMLQDADSCTLTGILVASLAVGGVAEPPDVVQAPAAESASLGASGPPYAALAGGLAAAVAVLGAGGWYVRRRRLG